MRCVRSGPDQACERCLKQRRACVTEPPKKPGAPKGVPRKRKSMSTSPDLSAASTSALANSAAPSFEALLNPFSLPSSQPPPIRRSFSRPSAFAATSTPYTSAPHLPCEHSPVPLAFSSALPEKTLPDRQLATLSNPLSLLAEVSDDKRDGGTSTYASPHHQAEQIAELMEGGVDPRLAALDLNLSFSQSSLITVMTPQLFKNEKQSIVQRRDDLVNRDLAPEHDPTHIGLVTEAEVMLYFHTFFSSCHPMNPTLCPFLHIHTFVRRRSMFLFSVILFIGALYTLDCDTSAKRLRYHVEQLARKVFTEGYRSTELVQAFITYQCWQPPSPKAGEDRLWLYTSLSVSMATELGLDRQVSAVRDERVRFFPSSSPTLHRFRDTALWFCADLTRQCFLSEQLAVLKDDLVDLPPAEQTDEMLGRLARNRERTWLRLFLWHSAVAVSSGSPSMLAEDDLLRNSEWWNDPLASQYDRITCALVQLRRLFIVLSLEVKARLQSRTEIGTAWIAPLVDSRLDPWKEKWVAGQAFQRNYLLLIHRHGRLWCLSAGLDPRIGTAEERQACVEHCLTAALDCCKRGLDDFREQSALWYITNSNAIMLAYSASLALRLYSCTDGYDPSASYARLLGLVASLALVLERMGTTPPHRFGLTAFYGRQLQRVVRSRAFALRKAHAQHDDNSLTAFLPNLDDLVVSNMSSFVDGSWDWLLGTGEEAPLDQQFGTNNWATDQLFAPFPEI
ncbi:hypothetical protein JCM8547_002596 [Rhodosporidiobolus lusitaniae]